MKEIKLTQGKVAIVDDEDYDYLLRYNPYWQAKKSSKADLWYAGCHVSGTKTEHMLMHRLLLDAPKGQLVDHINRDGLDNRRTNLRFASPAQNNQNKAGWSGGKYKGVQTRNKGKERHRAVIRIKGLNVYLGTFNTEDEAALFYNAAATKYFGNFAALNEVPTFAG